MVNDDKNFFIIMGKSIKKYHLNYILILLIILLIGLIIHLKAKALEQIENYPNENTSCVLELKDDSGKWRTIFAAGCYPIIKNGKNLGVNYQRNDYSYGVYLGSDYKINGYPPGSDYFTGEIEWER